jgi:hypothetical protein
MSTTILIVILVLGLIMPLFWIIGAMTSVGYFCICTGKDMIVRYQEKKASAGTTCKGRTVIPNPQLGFTMADGGDSIEKNGKESTERS